jgi:hypothetical protein
MSIIRQLDTGHLNFVVLGVFLDAIGKTVAVVAIRVCFSATTRTGRRFVRVLGALVVAIGDPVALGSCLYFSAAKFVCQSLFRVVGTFIVTIGNLVAVGVRLYFYATTKTGKPLFTNH